MQICQHGNIIFSEGEIAHYAGPICPLCSNFNKSPEIHIHIHIYPERNNIYRDPFYLDPNKICKEQKKHNEVAMNKYITLLDKVNSKKYSNVYNTNNT